MAQKVFTISSRLPIGDAFARCVDLTRVNEWDRGVTNPSLVGGTPGEVGARYEITVTGFDGLPTQVVYELLEVDAPARFVMEGATSVFRAHDVLTFELTDDGCELTYDGSLELLEDEPPLTQPELDSLFDHVAGVAESGLRTFLNP